MKKITILAFVAMAISFVSCKKDRTCTCTITQTSSTDNGMPQTLNAPVTEVVKLTKVTKKGAACNSGERTTTDSYISGNTNHTTVSVEKSDCKLS